MRAYDQRDEQRYYDRAEWGVMHDYQREVLADLCAILPDDARTILDVGCGDGAITDRLPGDRTIVGADLSPVALSGLGSPGVVCSVMGLPFRDGQFDLVMANDVVEHFSPQHRDRVLREMERVARRHIIVTVPFTERLAGSFSYTPREHVHRNRHKDSFDVETLRDFFSELELRACVFSGMTWEDELAPVEKLKLLEARLAEIVPEKAEQSELAEVIAKMLRGCRRRQAAYLCRHPERLDLLRRRTEVIALFSRVGTDGAALRHIGRAADFTKAREQGEERDLLRIEGACFDEHRCSHLPFSSLWPYAVFSGDAVVGKAGAQLTAASGEAISLKVGFFAPLEDVVAFEVALELDAPATMQLSRYEGGATAYRMVRSQALDAGHGTFRVDGLEPSLSEFGYLFEIVLDARRCTFVSCRVVQDRPARRATVAPGPSYLARHADGLALLTSVDGAPRRALPHWFAFAETLAASPGDPYYGSLDALRFELDRLRLEVEDEPGSARAELLAEVAGLRTQLTAAGAEMERSRAGQGELASTLEMTQLQLVRTRESYLSASRRLSLIESAMAPVKPLQRFAAVLRDVRGKLRRLRLPASASTRVPTGLEASAPPLRKLPRIGRASASDLPVAVTMLVADDRIDRRVLLQARSLAREGVDVTVVAAPYPDPVDLDATQFPDVSIVRIDTSRAVLNPPDVAGTRLGRHPFVWKDVYFYHEQFLKAAVENPAEIVVAHDLPVLAAAIGAADLTGADVFYDAHELYPEQLHFGPERMQLYRDAEAALIPHADVVTTINGSIAHEMARRYGVPSPLIILNAPAAPDAAVPVPKTWLLRDAFGLREDQRLVLFQGSLSFGRNLEALAASLAYVENPNVVLAFMGPGAAKRAELEAIAREHKLLGTRVFFHDAVPQNELLRYTASADIGIIPYPAIDLNTTFCTPNKLFEFMTAGLPILANDLPELRRFVADQGVGLVHAMTDAQAIAAGIDRICATDLTAFRAALEEVAPRMTWDAQGVLLLGIYRDFMRRRGRKAA